MRAVAVRDIANQLSLGRIAPTTSFVRRNNLIFRAATPKRAPRVAMFQCHQRQRDQGIKLLHGVSPSQCLQLVRYGSAQSRILAEIPAALKYRFAIVTIVARYLTFAVGTTKNELRPLR